MQETKDSAVLPSTRSAFVRPRRTRPDIAASPNLCIPLTFGDARHQGNDVSRKVQKTIENEKKLFAARWCNSEENTKNDLPSHGWVPISPATDPPPSILTGFETVELKLGERPGSPIPFLKESPLFDKANAEERSDTDPNTDGTVTPPTPPSSPHSRSNPETTTVSNKRLQLKITGEELRNISESIAAFLRQKLFASAFYSNN